MGKVIGGILSALVIAGLIIFLLFYFGVLGFGGSGDSKGGTNKEQSEIKETEEITIIVTQDEYFIDEQKVTLTQIKEKVTDESAVIKVVLENNYASAKAWDDIRTSLAEWGIIPIEQ